MGDLENFDPTPAVDLWMSKKKRKPRSSPKAKEQNWYRGVFSEATEKKPIPVQRKSIKKF